MALGGNIAKYVFDYLNGRSFLWKLQDVALLICASLILGAVYLAATDPDGFTTLYRTVIRAEDDKVNLNSAVALNLKIDEELSTILNTTEADRAFVAKFHNGRRDLQGFHFLYSSRINEVVGPGIASTLAIRQNVLLSVINEWVVRMLKRECVVIQNVGPSHPFYTYLREGGVRATIFCPMYSLKGELIGKVGLEYVGQAPSQPILNAHMNILKESAIRLSGMFSLSQK